MKQCKYWPLIVAIWLGIANLGCAQNKNTIAIADNEKLIEFTTDKFTLPNIHVTPDGKSIIFDVLGDIYQVPIEGGNANVLVQDNHWKRAGKLSPNGKTLAYVSDETGEFQVWTMDLITQEKKVFPIKEFLRYPLYPYWKDDKHLLIPSKEGLQNFNILTGKSLVIRPALAEEKSVLHAPNRTMSVNYTGEYALFQKNGELWAYDLNKSIDLVIAPIPDKAFLEFVRGSVKRDKVMFYKRNKEDDLKQDLVRWDLNLDKLKILNTTQSLGYSTFLSYSFDYIDDDTIVLDKEGAIVRMDIKTGEYEPIPIKLVVKKLIKKPLHRKPLYIRDSIITASVLRNPVTRKDLDTIYFGAFGKLHSFTKETGEIIEFYPKENRFEISPSLSPDGRYIAYTTWKDTEMGHVYVREIKTGKEYQITQTSGRYINPTWSPDGTEIVFIADETEAKLGIPRQSGGTNTSNYHLDLHKSQVLKNKNIQEFNQTDTISRVYPMSILPRRFYPIPVYHSNGESIFITSRNHEKNLPVLLEIDLKSKKVLKERLIPFHTDEVIISPDTQHIAFVFDEKVWVDAFPFALKLEYSENSEFVLEQLHYEGGYVTNILLPETKSVYEIAPSYLYWQDEYTLMWGSADEIYTYDVRTGKTEKTANIKVQIPTAAPKTQYAFTNARIITMNKKDEIINKGTILINDNRIEAVGEVDEIMITKNYKVFDLEGKTVMPGLIDVHAHYHHFPYEFQEQQNYKYIGNLAYGVTTIYDPSVNVLDYRERSQMVETGRLLGPRVFASGNIILDPEQDYDFRVINSKYDTDRIIKSNQKLGVNGPLKQYNRKNRKHRKWIYESAKEFNMTVTNHELDFILAMTQIIDGYTAMEHEKYTFPIQKDIIELIAESGIHYTPTFMVSPRIGDLFLKETLHQNEKLKKLNGELLYHNNYAKFSFNLDSLSRIERNKDLEMRKIAISKSSRILKKIVKAGGKVSIGGHGNPLPGIGTHWELWAFTYDKGLTNYEAIQAATINGAEKLELQEELGSIEKEKLADLLVLNNDPLKNILNSIEILYTVHNGNIFDVASMQHIYPIENNKMLGNR